MEKFGARGLTADAGWPMQPSAQADRTEKGKLRAWRRPWSALPRSTRLNPAGRSRMFFFFPNLSTLLSEAQARASLRPRRRDRRCGKGSLGAGTTYAPGAGACRRFSCSGASMPVSIPAAIEEELQIPNSAIGHLSFGGPAMPTLWEALPKNAIATCPERGIGVSLGGDRRRLSGTPYERA